MNQLRIESDETGCPRNPWILWDAVVSLCHIQFAKLHIKEIAAFDSFQTKLIQSHRESLKKYLFLFGYIVACSIDTTCGEKDQLITLHAWGHVKKNAVFLSVRDLVS